MLNYLRIKFYLTIFQLFIYESKELCTCKFFTFPSKQILIYEKMCITHQTNWISQRLSFTIQKTSFKIISNNSEPCPGVNSCFQILLCIQYHTKLHFLSSKFPPHSNQPHRKVIAILRTVLDIISNYPMGVAWQTRLIFLVPASAWNRPSSFFPSPLRLMAMEPSGKN